MSYQIVLVDVDGTLVCARRKFPTENTVRVLRALQERKIPVAICTGRSFFAVRPQVMGGFRPDYCICNNGAQGIAGDGTVLWEETLSNPQIEELIALFRENRYALHLNFKDGYYTYVADPEHRYWKYYEETNGDMACIKAGRDCSRHLTEPALDGWGMLPDEAAARFNRVHHDLVMIPFVSGSYDICRTDVSKMTGAQKLLMLLGLDWPQAVAIGDGENDLSLLERAGLGIAMGNAPAHVRERADEVAKPVLEEGAADALKKIFLL